MLQRSQVSQRLHCRAGLSLRLRRSVQLAERIRKTAGHGEDAAGLVLEHERGALHGRPHAQLRLPRAWCARRGGLAFRLSIDASWLDNMDIDHIVKPEPASNCAAPYGERQGASIGKPDANRFIAFLAT